MSEVIIQGLLLSGLYALLAIGFTMIFSVGRVLNLAYGAFIMLGGYTYYYFTQTLGIPKLPGFLLAAASGAVLGMLIYFALAGIPKTLSLVIAVCAGIAFGRDLYLVIAPEAGSAGSIVSILIAAGAGALVGWLLYKALIKPMLDDPIAVEISTLILAVVFQVSIIRIFDDAARTMWPLVEGVARFGNVSVTHNIIAATVVSWIVLGSLLVFVRYTHVGRAIQAVSMDRKGAIISGIDPQRINLITWGISGALAAIAGVFFATQTQLSPEMWVAPLIIAVAVVIVGGIGSIVGSLVAAHIIGFMEVFTTTVISPELRGVFTMALIIIVLVVSPKGLLGKEEL